MYNVPVWSGHEINSRFIKIIMCLFHVASNVYLSFNCPTPIFTRSGMVFPQTWLNVGLRQGVTMCEYLPSLAF